MHWLGGREVRTETGWSCCFRGDTVPLLGQMEGEEKLVVACKGISKLVLISPIPFTHVLSPSVCEKYVDRNRFPDLLAAMLKKQKPLNKNLNIMLSI